jgi:hypothetical protein
MQATQTTVNLKLKTFKTVPFHTNSNKNPNIQRKIKRKMETVNFQFINLIDSLLNCYMLTNKLKLVKIFKSKSNKL